MIGQSICTPATADRWYTPLAGASPEQIAIGRRALADCDRCPLRGCSRDIPIALRKGVILDGVPYNEFGKPLPRCEQCGRWCLGKQASAKYCGARCASRANMAQAAERRLAVAA